MTATFFCPLCKSGRFCCRGFTLVEILVVLTVLGVLLSLAVANPPKTDARVLQTEARRLHALLQYASDEAVTGGVELGLALSEGGYAFLQYDVFEGRWLSPSDPLLRPRQLPSAIQVGLALDQTDLPKLAGLDETEVARRSPALPLLLLLSSGETTPFRLSLQSGELSSGQILSDGFSGIRLVADDSS